MRSKPSAWMKLIGLFAEYTEIVPYLAYEDKERQVGKHLQKLFSQWSVYMLV